MLTKYEGLVNKNYAREFVASHLSKPGKEVLEKTIKDTKTALEKMLNGKIKSSSVKGHDNPGNKNNGKYIRYTPAEHGITNSSNNINNPNQRIIKISELPKDPLEPVKYKHKRIPRDAGEEPIPIMHSPPRKLTLKDQQDWKVGPCISNWKNAKGYTIPLEMRLSADGRNLRDFTVSEKFSKFADVLYTAEKQARLEIEERNKMQESIKIVNTLKKEEELREAAKEARMKKMSMAVSNISSVKTTKTEETEIMLGNKRRINEDIEAEKIERDNLRNIRKKEIERDRRFEIASKKGKIHKAKDEDRDVSEKIALGQAQPTLKDTMIDARLYNQTVGLEAGFKDEEDYDLYDKPLFVDRSAASIYKNVRGSTSIDDDVNESENLASTKKLMEKIYQRGKMFEGADVSKAEGGRPIEFEKDEEKYGLNDIHKKHK
jgi:SNW domain-containing protein 1